MSEPSRDPVRRALRSLTHGVYVLSVRHDNRDDYLVVSLATQCSVEPPRIAFALSVNARILAAYRSARGGVLSVLDAKHIAAVRRYGAPGGVRHLPADVAISSHSHPIPPEASFWLELRHSSEQAVGDHQLFVADVVGAGSNVDSADVDASGAFAALTLSESGFPYAG